MQIKSPLISVVMSVYKEPIEWLRQSIDSILNQTFRDFEFIIICDNPQYIDGLELLEEYRKRDDRIIIIHNEQNIGLTKSLNKGLAIAQGEYIARMDADDIASLSRFQKQLSIFVKRQNVDVCGSNVAYFGKRRGEKKFPEDERNMYFFIENPIAHSSVMMRRKVAELKYDETCRAAQDYELWSRALEEGYHFYNIQEPLLSYRWSETQISSMASNKQAEVANKVRRKLFDNYCSTNKLDCRMAEKDISWELISEILDVIQLSDDYLKDFIFFLLLSIKGEAFRKIWKMMFNKNIRILTLRQKGSVLLHAIKKDNVAKY